MRVIRLGLLLVVILLAFLATPTFNLQPLATLIPADLLADSTRLVGWHYWTIEQLTRFSLLSTALASLTFGVLSMPWPAGGNARFVQTAINQPPTDQAQSRGHVEARRYVLGVLLIFLTLASATVLMALYLRNGTESLLLHGLWVGSIVAFLLAARLLTKVPRPPLSTLGLPEITGGWVTAIGLLLFVLFYYGWGMVALPTQTSESAVQRALHAATLVADSNVALFAAYAPSTQPTEVSATLALVPTALLFWLTRDLLLSTQLLGLVAALFCGLGTWLLGRELFARRVGAGELYAPVEDNGRSLALTATLLVLTNLALLYFSRQPILLLATGWGIGGCWLLLRGIQRADRLALGLSGLCLGLAILFHNRALVYGVIGLCWWLGFAAARLGLLPHYIRAAKTEQTRSAPLKPPAATLVWGDWWLWLLGLLLVILPYLPALIDVGQQWSSRLPLLWMPTLVAIFTSLDPPTLTYPAPIFHPILLPLLALAAGGLLFNLDRRQGWLIASWLLIALGGIVLMRPSTMQWEPLLALIPATALAMAFALDRLRVTLVRVGGRWLRQLLLFLLVGLLLWMALYSGITYYTYLPQQRDLGDRVGQLLRARTAEQAVVILQDSTEPQLTAADSQLQFLVAPSGVWPAEIEFVTELPLALAPGSLVIVPAQQRFWLPRLLERYPNGIHGVVRDHAANPLAYTYSVANAPSSELTPD